MREIKFRASASEKDGTRGDFVYGYYVVTHERPGRSEHWIILENGQHVLVYEDSVGQFTGLHDKNGKEIYDGDIVKYVRWPDRPDIVEKLTCEWDGNGSFSFPPSRYVAHQSLSSSLEIIGNIYENPDLLPS